MRIRMWVFFLDKKIGQKHIPRQIAQIICTAFWLSILGWIRVCVWAEIFAIRYSGASNTFDPFFLCRLFLDFYQRVVLFFHNKIMSHFLSVQMLTIIISFLSEQFPKEKYAEKW